MENFVKTEPILFYVDYPYDEQRDEIKELYKKYFEKGVIGFEQSKSGVKHLQSFVVGTKAKYYAFIAKWKAMYLLKTGKNATGRATKGNRKNYGKVKNIKKDSDCCIAYCTKDNDYFFWNYPEEYIAECNEISYTKLKETPSMKRDYVTEVMKNFRKDQFTTWDDLMFQDKVDCIECVMKTHYEKFGNIPSHSVIEIYKIKSGMETFRKKAEKYVNFENNIF